MMCEYNPKVIISLYILYGKLIGQMVTAIPLSNNWWVPLVETIIAEVISDSVRPVTISLWYYWKFVLVQLYLLICSCQLISFVSGRIPTLIPLWSLTLPLSTQQYVLGTWHMCREGTWNSKFS